MKKHASKSFTVQIFSSFEEENEFEYERRKKMTKQERCREFAELQKRRWGAHWTSMPIKKVVSIEKRS